MQVNDSWKRLSIYRQCRSAIVMYCEDSGGSTVGQCRGQAVIHLLISRPPLKHYQVIRI